MSEATSGVGVPRASLRPCGPRITFLKPARPAAGRLHDHRSGESLTICSIPGAARARTRGSIGPTGDEADQFNLPRVIHPVVGITPAVLEGVVLLDPDAA